MSGIDRLRAIAGAWDEWGLGGALAEIADEIERERAEDCYRMGLDCGTVWRVVADMERHCLGHEGMEDSPVARWARELRGALKSDASDERDTQNPSCADHDGAADVTSEAPKVTRDPAEDVSMSAYDLLPADERDAIAWVREHGGIEAVKEEWNHSRNLKRSLETAQAKVERQQRHIELVQGKCKTRVHRIVELSRQIADMRPRLMPDGCQWPRYESGELIGFGDDVSRNGEDFEVKVIALYRDGSFSLDFWAYSKDERVKRPAVFAADGEPLEVGQTVYVRGKRARVIEITKDSLMRDMVRFEYASDESVGRCGPDDLIHQRPVLDADGVPIREGDTVWRVNGDGPFMATEYRKPWMRAKTKDGRETGFWPDDLTHTKPEIDSWERIEEDAESYDQQLDASWVKPDGCEVTASDIVRRCRALAERERGE